MWSLKSFKLIFAVVAILGLLICSTSIWGQSLPKPSEERFSEMYLLNASNNSTSGLPNSLTAGKEYVVTLGVGNHMAEPQYYIVKIKFTNNSDSLPNILEKKPSNLSTLYNYNVFLNDGRNWEENLTFSFSNFTFYNSSMLIPSIVINDVAIDVNKNLTLNNSTSRPFCEIIAELWIYNASNDSFSYHNRFVSLRLEAEPNT
jgi:hypothetical protein